MKRVVAILILAVLLVGMLPTAAPEANAAAALLWPVPGHFALSRGYSSSHGAMDIHDSTINGANIVAAMGGTIVRISNCTVQHYGEECSCGGTGTGVVIKGTDNRYYSYAHMTAGSIPSDFVANKTKVNAGDFLGRVGTTGNSSGPHLHFSIATGSNYLDNRINPEYETYTNVGKTAFTFAALPSKMSVSDNDAVIAVSLSKPANNRLISYGATVYDHNGNVLGTTSAKSSGQVGTAKPELWWTVSSSMGITLNPGRTYQFSFWANVSGVTIASAKYSFTTMGTAVGPYIYSFDANGGTGAPAGLTVYYGDKFQIPAATPTREGYTFKGWNVMRNGDQKWYCTSKGWCTEAEITAGGYSKYWHYPETEFTVSNVWVNGCADTTGFTFYAQWEKTGPITDPNLKFAADPGLSFQEYIGLQVMFKNSAASDYDKFYVEIQQITPDGVVTSTSTGIPYNSTYRYFEQQIVSWSMTDEVTMTLYAEKDGLLYQGASFTTTVKDLAMEKLATYYEAVDLKTCKALVDMLNYGAAVQTAYDYNAASLPNADLGKYAVLGTTGTPAMTAANNITGTNKIKVYSANISLQDKVEFQFMVKTSDLSGKTVKATLNGANVDVAYTEYGSYTIIRVAAAAAHMRDTYTIVINDANGNPVTCTYNVSVEAYAKDKLSDEKAAAFIAMMRYGDAVAAL